MERILVLNLVGLTPRLLHGGHMPALKAYAESQEQRSVTPPLPALTCTAQADMLMGVGADRHGAVANGWYFRDLSEVWLWRQSCHLIDGGGKLESLFQRWKRRYPDSTTAQVFWWWNLPGFADFCITPRPTYFADGRKGPDIHTNPPSLREELAETLGEFPLFQFWGPGAGIASTRWIAEATIHMLEEHRPGLAMAYLPHLDYDLQRFGPEGPEAQAAAAELDHEFQRLLDSAGRLDYRIVVVSEYGIEAVEQAVLPNRVLREAGLLQVHPARNGTLLDPGNSRAFAVCDHQVAHVYVEDPRDIPSVRALLEDLDGVDQVLEGDAITDAGLGHERSGELILIAEKGRWFAYPYWKSEEPEPDFARTVEIHRKPGYDPLELFLDPEKPLLKQRLALKLLAKKLGFRILMNPIPLDTTLVRGSHGRPPSSAEEGPLWIGPADLCPAPQGESLPAHQAFQKFADA
ncbi:MAG: alkaline phosphatase family protein [Planctomycetota bacterium]|jgi:predicted AlkP superfamily pyrophosphatase or phosphodiesterase